MSSSYAPLQVDAFNRNGWTELPPDMRVVISDGSEVYYLTKEAALAFAAEVARVAESLPDTES